MAPFTTGIRQPHTGDGLVYINGTWVPANLGQAIPAAQAPSYTGIPLTPKHDDEWVYQVTAGIYWRFKYDLYTAYWNFIGGPPVRVFQSAAIPMSAGSTFTNINPTYNVPFAGDYDVRSHALINNITTAADCLLGTAIGGSSVGFYGQDRLSANESGTIFTEVPLTGLSANAQLNPMGWTNNPTPGNTGYQWIRMYVIPTRVH